MLLLLSLVACSGGGAKAPARTDADAGAKGDAGASAPMATTPAPSNLPPMASMPPPGVAGSKKAKRRPDAALATCAGAARGVVKDPAEAVKRMGEACAAASKMKPASAILRGQQADRDTHQENRFHAEANHCYRVYLASEEPAKDVVAVLRDSAGDIVAEATGPAVPEEGAVCFTTSDDVTVLVGVGSGKGAWAAQVWSD